MTKKTIIKLLKDSRAFAKERAKNCGPNSGGIEDFWLGKIQGLEFAIQLIGGSK